MKRIKNFHQIVFMIQVNNNKAQHQAKRKVATEDQNKPERRKRIKNPRTPKVKMMTYPSNRWWQRMIYHNRICKGNLEIIKIYKKLIPTHKIWMLKKSMGSCSNNSSIKTNKRVVRITKWGITVRINSSMDNNSQGWWISNLIWWWEIEWGIIIPAIIEIHTNRIWTNNNLDKAPICRCRCKDHNTEEIKILEIKPGSNTFPQCSSSSHMDNNNLCLMATTEGEMIPEDFNTNSISSMKISLQIRSKTTLNLPQALPKAIQKASNNNSISNLHLSRWFQNRSKRETLGQA